MPAPGAQFGSIIGPNLSLNYFSRVAYEMAAINTGWCARFTAYSVNDIKSVRLFWSSVSAAGTVQIRIETIDTATGKPTGTLYDANATINITPVAGIQTYTFATLPTTGLTVGTEYAIVLLTTVAGTTQTLGSHIASAGQTGYPTIVLAAVDGTIRTNFAEVTSSTPLCSLVDESDIERPEAFLPYTAVSLGSIYVYSTTNFAAQKFIINTAIKIAGVVFMIGKNGTPAGDLRIRIFDSANNVIAGSTVTLNATSLINSSPKRAAAIFPSIIELAAGTYRIVFDSAGSANSTNAFSMRTAAFLHANAVNPWRSSTSSDAVNWTDSTTTQAAVYLLLDDFVAGAGGGGLLINSGMVGGIRG